MTNAQYLRIEMEGMTAEEKAQYLFMAEMCDISIARNGYSDTIRNYARQARTLNASNDVLGLANLAHHLAGSDAPYKEKRALVGLIAYRVNDLLDRCAIDVDQLVPPEEKKKRPKKALLREVEQ